jgi:hypothetical protein
MGHKLKVQTEISYEDKKYFSGHSSKLVCSFSKRLVYKRELLEVLSVSKSVNNKYCIILA